MIRKAFLMSVNPGAIEEYQRRHSPIWEDLAQTLKDHGVSNYSIFFDPVTHGLFGYAEIASEQQWEAIAATPSCRRWWKHMGDIMPANPDSSPVSRGLREVFHLA